jgi:hypothetical protein
VRGLEDKLGVAGVFVEAKPFASSPPPHRAEPFFCECALVGAQQLTQAKELIFLYVRGEGPEAVFVGEDEGVTNA